MEDAEMIALAERRVDARLSGVQITVSDRECAIADEMHFLQRLHANTASAVLAGMAAAKLSATVDDAVVIAIQCADALLSKLGEMA